MEKNTLRLGFNGGSSIVPLLATKNPNTRTPITDIIILRRTPLTEACLKPQYRPRRCSGRIPQYPREASPTSSPNPASLIAAKAIDKRSTRTSLVERLQMQGSCPLRLLRNDGYWNRDQFWAVVDFLRHASRSHQILRLFEAWRNIKSSPITELDYKMIIVLLCEECLLDDAASALKQMKSDSLSASLQTYNSILCGLANEGRFKELSFLLYQLKEPDLVLNAETYKGLIRAYGKNRMFDEMDLCVKKMEADGCSLDHVTYNLLIREYSRGGLIHHMERITRILLSKRMYLQPSSLYSILEVYTNFGILSKMERAYIRVFNSKIPLAEDLIRKMASVYLENFMFSRLDELGLNHPWTEIGDLSWCLRLLSHACLSSQRGIDSVIDRMAEERVPWSVTLMNIVLLAHLKLKDIKRLRILLSQLPARNVKPDIVTVGVLLDMSRIGFDVNGILYAWRRIGFLYGEVELRTDPLVITAIGKSLRLNCYEQIFSGLEPEARDRKRWTYSSLIDLVSKI